MRPKRLQQRVFQQYPPMSAVEVPFVVSQKLTFGPGGMMALFDRTGVRRLTPATDCNSYVLVPPHKYHRP